MLARRYPAAATLDWRPGGRLLSTVLFICTANQCRSPMAEVLLRKRLTDYDLGWTVRSAGTRAIPGLPMHPLAARALADRGVPVGRWVSQGLEPDIIDGSTLILTATRAHLRQVVTKYPAAIQHSFVFGQFARLLSHIPPGQMARTPTGLIELALKARAQLQPRPADKDDIKDPVGGKYGAFKGCADIIELGLDSIVGHVHPGQPRAQT